LTVDPQWQLGRRASHERGHRATRMRQSAVNRVALSRAITFSGGNAAYVALLALLYQKTQSASLVGLGALASFGVPALTSPVAGWIGDRFDRKQVMVTSEILGGACFFLMAVLPSPPVLLLLRVAASLVSAPFVPATSAALPSLVDHEEQLPAANAKLAAASILGGLVGAVSAAGLMLISDPETVFLFNAVTFMASAGLIASISADFRPTRTFSGDGHVSPLAAGFRYLAHHHLLRPVTLAYAIIFLAVGLTGAAEVVLCIQFGAGAVGFAAFTCVFALGGIAGTRLASRGLLRTSVGPLAMLALASGVLAVGFVTVGFAPGFSLALAGMAVAGAAYGIWRVAHENVIQRMTPDAIRGRVFAASEAVEQAGISFGLLGAGGFVSAFGAATAFRVGAAGSIVSFLLLARISFASLPPVARIRRRSPLASLPPKALLSPPPEQWARTAHQGTG
jgi:Major Facilitator Superfamily